MGEGVKIKKPALPCCPFCGVKLKYLESFVVKNNSVYKCTDCDQVSKISLKSNIYKILWISQIASISVFGITVFLGGEYALIGLAITMILFGCFYALSPCMFLLEEPSYIYIRKKISWYDRIRDKMKAKKQKSAKISEEKIPKLDIGKNKNDNRDIFSN